MKNSGPHASRSSENTTATVYYLAFRLRPTHPWRSQEFLNRFEAHSRYKALRSDGYEAYLESRRKKTQLAA